ncbi:MAG TPA: histone [Polyangia bacterium]|nr:histone [Polyangia bacterium]
MIRNTMFGLSLLALSGATAFAAPMAKHQTRAKVVAQAPAADSAAPKADAPAKDAKKTKHVKKAKTDATKADAPKADAPATK